MLGYAARIGLYILLYNGIAITKVLLTICD